MLDLKNSFATLTREYPMLSTAAVTQEGQPLILVADATAGVLKLKECTGAGGEIFGGFAYCDATKKTTETVVANVTVPIAPGPYTVNLGKTNIVGTSPAAQIRVVNVGTGVALTQVAGAPAAGEFSVAVSTGIVTFNAAQAGVLMLVTYSYTLSQADIDMKFHSRFIGNTAQETFDSMAVLCGQGEVYTDIFDVTQAYALGGAIYLGANGRLTSAAGGTEVGKCKKLPTTGSDGVLGVIFTNQY